MKTFVLFILSCSSVLAQAGKDTSLFDWSPESPIHDSIVFIVVTLTSTNGSVAYAQGSGVVTGPTQIMTAAHVIDGAVKITVWFQHKTAVVATVTAVDTDTDVAVLKCSVPEGSVVAKIASVDPKIGDKLECCGHGGNLGLRHWYVISGGTNGLRQVHFGYTIQGDSGGGVFNANNELVGLITGGVIWLKEDVVGKNRPVHATVPVITSTPQSIQRMRK